MRPHRDVRFLAFGLTAALALSTALASDRATSAQAESEAERLAARIRDRLVQTRAQLDRYGYFEEDTEVQLDGSGLERERESRVYAVSPAADGGYPDSRLASVDGRPPTPAEREEDDGRRAGERTESRRETRDASHRRQTAIEDLHRGLVVRIDGRATIDGEETTIVAFEPKPGARLQSRAARFIRAMRGRVWVTAPGDVVQVDAALADNVSVGWGVIARIWQGSWLRARQHRRDGVWLPLELTAEAQGRTLLFRSFHTRYIVKYWGYRLGARPE
jgi:hypothetical protein